MWERMPEKDLQNAQAAACEVVSTLAADDGTLTERFRIRLTCAVSP